jgi:hypothetical protein
MCAGVARVVAANANPVQLHVVIDQTDQLCVQSPQIDERGGDCAAVNGDDERGRRDQTESQLMVEEVAGDVQVPITLIFVPVEAEEVIVRAGNQGGHLCGMGFDISTVRGQDGYIAAPITAVDLKCCLAVSQLFEVLVSVHQRVAADCRGIIVFLLTKATITD